jgi:beta-lactamase class A
MIAYSDNNATYLLNTNCNETAFMDIFTDLGLKRPSIHDTSYSITVKDYSVFMRVLYNATYLNKKNSDQALSLLTQSSFKMGIANKLPSDLVIARKFGEMKIENKRELHESGIIYCNKRPYLLTLMTKGYNPVHLAGIISQISESVYKTFCN